MGGETVSRKELKNKRGGEDALCKIAMKTSNGGENAARKERARRASRFKLQLRRGSTNEGR